MAGFIHSSGFLKKSCDDFVWVTLPYLWLVCIGPLKQVLKQLSRLLFV